MTPPVHVADAGAMIAYVRRETGWNALPDALDGAGSIVYSHAAQLAEVFYDSLRSDGEEVALDVFDDLLAAGVRPREDMDTAFWQDVAHLKAGTNPSFALALARRIGGTVLTTDRHELDKDEVKALCQVRFIR